MLTASAIEVGPCSESPTFKHIYNHETLLVKMRRAGRAAVGGERRQRTATSPHLLRATGKSVKPESL